MGQRSIRALRPDEPIPDGEPARYHNSCGYVRLRWRIAPWTQVEAYEHRIVAEQLIGRPLEPYEHVHHRNGVPDDNRPENLEVLTFEEHIARHADERRVDAHRVVSLYASGFSTTEVGKIVGRDASVISRTLKAAGVRARPFGNRKSVR